MSVIRRNLFKGALVGALAPALPVTAATRTEPVRPRWGVGADGQRKADLGDGTFQNPIVAGDHPDPTILKDGDDYYMTFSSFLSYPGLIIWRSTDLVNWTPIGPALKTHLGVIWAVDLVKHGDRYFIYIPADPKQEGWSIFVIWADDIGGPWSDPIDLNIHGCIDPGHVVGEDGRRYLFTNGIRKIRLSDDGLATDGALEHAYSPWRYPDDWVVENFAPEGPKLLRRGDWFYLITAVGGTAGPPTGHMVIAARSRSIHGPWEHCPRNPLVRTTGAQEPWWSRGHATLVEGPAADWWMVYHGYENGRRTLGRQTLLEPIEWTDDGWFRAMGGDLSRPLPKPRGGRAGPSAPALSDDFSADRMGLQWAFHGEAESAHRATYEGRGLRVQGQGKSPTDSAPLVCVVGDPAYDAEIALDLEGDAEAGLLLFYNSKAFVGVGFTPTMLKTFQFSEELTWMRADHQTRRVRFRVSNADDIVTWFHSYDDGANWIRNEMRMEVSGMHHNVFGGFLSLRVGVYVAGQGSAILRDFRYAAALPTSI
ncbi:MAG: family 43 glycosylhydrolase [Brevundimonas sp.]|uniref:family 43 glycosylhydrolase n=1 Tax=Brevundimonas sp. TaxID=1871086 RepID=UPI0028CFF8B3|nr:family 43 glycosylhydrolase [uncultured Brevundimonas sp.]